MIFHSGLAWDNDAPTRRETQGAGRDDPDGIPMKLHGISWLVVTGTMEFYDFPYIGINGL